MSSNKQEVNFWKHACSHAYKNEEAGGQTYVRPLHCRQTKKKKTLIPWLKNQCIIWDQCLRNLTKICRNVKWYTVGWQGVITSYGIAGLNAAPTTSQWGLHTQHTYVKLTATLLLKRAKMMKRACLESKQSLPTDADMCSISTWVLSQA